MKPLSAALLVFLLCAFEPSHPRSSLHNGFTSEKIQDFAREVQRQALLYPNSYFLEKITDKK